MITSCKHAGEIEYDGFVQNEKLEIFTYKALDVTRKKKTRHFTIFSDFISIIQTFCRSGKLRMLGKFQNFKNSRLWTNPEEV